MNKIDKNHWRLIVSVVLLGLWAGLSIYGSFLGSQRAASFFQSFPLSLFWLTCLVFLLFSLLYIKLWTQPFLFMLHLGAAFVLAAGFWGSPKASAWRNHIWGTSEISKGFLFLAEKESERTVVDSDGRVLGSLPFDIVLERFTTSFYESPGLPIPRQYESRITIRQPDGSSSAYTIQVNRPLFYGGYLFYQHSWGKDEKGLYSVIGIVNNRGLSALLAGYILLVLGAAGQFWVIPFLRSRRKERPYSS